MMEAVNGQSVFFRVRGSAGAVEVEGRVVDMDEPNSAFVVVIRLLTGVPGSGTVELDGKPFSALKVPSSCVVTSRPPDFAAAAFLSPVNFLGEYHRATEL